MMALKSGLSGTAFVTALAFSSGASAQTPPMSASGTAPPPVVTSAESDTASSDDIIVTANRREERLQSVGISVTAVSGDALIDRNIRTAEDLARIVPGLNSTASSGSGVSTLVIRGVGQTDFSDHQEAPNATYQDGVYIPFSTAVGIPIFDLARAEALRGPQGTLFGRNATGGLVQYISNKPQSGTSGAIEFGAGDRRLRRLQGFFNAGNDLIAGRIAYFYQTQRGFIKNVLGDDRGNKEVYALRGQILITPGPDTTINLRAEGFNQFGTSPGYVSTPTYYGANDETFELPATLDYWGTGPGNDANGYRNPYGDLKVALNDPGQLDKRSRTYSATITQGIGDATLTSITSYGTVNSLYREDTDSSPVDQFNAGLESSGNNFQQDLRVSGSTDSLRYTLGAYYLNVKTDTSVFNAYGNNPIVVPRGQINRNFFTVRTKSKAVYGQVEYDLTDKLTAILGGRYTWDDLRLDFRNQCTTTVIGRCGPFGGAGSPVLGTFPGIGPIVVDNNSSDWSGKFQLNFKPVEDVLLYASASKGLKSGGYTAPLSPRLPLNKFAYIPENLYAFEVGEKAQFFDRKVTLNSSIYYYDYKNLQSFLFSGTAVQVINLPAKAYGAEVELSARPTPTLSGNIGLAYSHFEIKDVPFSTGPQRPNNAPRLQVTWGLTKSFELTSDYDLSLNYYGRYISKVAYNILQNTKLIEAPSYSVHDFGARLESKQGWFTAVYLNNAFDKRYIVGAFDVTQFGYVLRSYGETRTFSVAAGIKF
jgi:iron complex outermembrane recepter protein